MYSCVYVDKWPKIHKLLGKQCKKTEFTELKWAKKDDHRQK